MKTWNSDASDLFEAWLGRVRLSIAGDPSLNAEDITQDLRAHVHAELEASPEPVTRGELERVLNGLGNPTQWTDPARGAAAPPKVRFYTGASDAVSDWQQKLAGEWGMPVLIVLLTIIAIPTFDDLVGVPLLAFAYFVARSKVTYGAANLSGAVKWMVYFPLAIGAGLLTGLVLGFPMTLQSGYSRPFEAMWALGAWWVIVGVASSREPKIVRSALRPFAANFDAPQGRVLAGVGLAFLIAGSVLVIAR